MCGGELLERVIWRSDEEYPGFRCKICNYTTLVEIISPETKKLLREAAEALREAQEHFDDCGAIRVIVTEYGDLAARIEKELEGEG
jgi:hypothetical protein